MEESVGGQPHEQQGDGGVVGKGGVHVRIRQDDVKALVATAPTDGNPIEITADDTRVCHFATYVLNN